MSNTRIYCPTRAEPSSQESLPKQRLIQSSLRKSLISYLCFSHRVFLADLSYGGALFPGAILVAVAVGRFAENRSPPTSPWANQATILLDPPGPRLWRGQRWRAIRGRGRECGRDSLELFFELESEGATRWLSCGITPFGFWFTPQSRWWPTDRIRLLVCQHVPKDCRDSSHHRHSSDLRTATPLDPSIPLSHLRILL